MSKTEKRPVGRPHKFPSLRALKDNIDKYFKECKEEKRPYTVSGLALALGTSRQMLCNIENLEHYEPEFIDTIKKAKMRCEVRLEEDLVSGKGSTAGVIFALKNNYGWRDKQEIETTATSPAAQLEASKERARRKKKPIVDVDPVEEATVVEPNNE